MIEQQDETNRLLTLLVEQSQLPTQPVRTVARSSAKLQAAVAYLQVNKKARKLSGRQLAAQVTEPKCSYVLWNQAKKGLPNG